MTQVEIAGCLQAAALNDLDNSWLAPLDAPLIDRARASLLGRRILAVHLAKQSSLFAEAWTPQAEREVLAGQGDWPWRSLRNLRPALLEMAALAAAEDIRAIISRDQVLRLRRVLGNERYLRALRYSSIELTLPDWMGGHVPELPDDDDLLADDFHRIGVNELYRYAEGIHERLAERVRLAFPKDYLEPDSAARVPIADLQNILIGSEPVEAGSVR